MSTPQLSLSIIVISFNQSQLVSRCLESVIRMSGDIDYEIILVDNGSTDCTTDVVADRFPSVNILQNKYNLGFAAANNQGIRASRGRYIFLLNQDAEVVEGSLSSLIRIMDEHPKIGIIGCKVILPDGVLQPTYNPFPTLWNTLFPKRKKLATERRLVSIGRDLQMRRDLACQYTKLYGYDCFHEVPNVSGVAMAARRAMWEQVGLFDERFFMYYEDLDWSARARKAGWKVFYTPKCTICHQYHPNSKNPSRRDPRRAMAAPARLLYFRKNRPLLEYLILAVAHLLFDHRLLTYFWKRLIWHLPRST
jgi:GT2 family glycosyltransferase